MDTRGLWCAHQPRLPTSVVGTLAAGEPAEPYCCVSSIDRAELVPRIGQVPGDRVMAERQALRDLPVGESAASQVQDLDLTVGEPGGTGWSCRSAARDAPYRVVRPPKVRQDYACMTRTDPGERFHSQDPCRLGQTAI